MAKILVINLPVTGHVQSTLPVVRELVKRGETVVSYNTEAYRQQSESAGAIYRAYPDVIDETELAQSITGGDMTALAVLLARTTERLMNWLIDEIGREAPDYALYDSLCLWGYCASFKMGLPQVSMMSTFGRGRPDVPLQQLARSIPNRIAFRQIERRLRKRYRLPSVSLADALNLTGDINLVFTARALQSNSDHFSDRCFFVGSPHDSLDDVLQVADILQAFGQGEVRV